MDHGVTLAVALLSLGEIQKTGMALQKNGSGTCHWPRPDMFVACSIEKWRPPL